MLFGRELAASEMEMSALLAIPGGTTGPAPESMRKAFLELQSSDEEIEGICQGLTEEKAMDLRLKVWKSDANSAAKLEMRRFLTFMKGAAYESGSFPATQSALASELYSVAARHFWRTTANGRRLPRLPVKRSPRTKPGDR